MKKLMMLAVAALTWTACGNKGSQASVDADSTQVATDTLGTAGVPQDSVTMAAFDINKYVDEMVDKAMVWYSKGADDVRLIAYALVDVDGDGHPEVWVKGDEGQDYQGVYSIVNDTVTLLASSDVRSELEFYKGAVGFSGYYGDGLSRKGFTFVKNSREGDSYFHENKFDNSSEEQEDLYDEFMKNGDDCSEEEWARAEQLLGDTISLSPVWHPIERKMKLSDYAE